VVLSLLEPIQLEAMRPAQNFFLTASLALLFAPPLFYHLTCLLLNRAWAHRLSIVLLYALNLGFLKALAVREFVMSGGENFLIDLQLFDPQVLIFYRIVLLATLGMACLRILEYYPKSFGQMRSRAQALLFSLPLLVLGFSGAPGFHHVLLNFGIRADAPFAFVILILIMGYAVTFYRATDSQGSPLKLLFFIAALALFILGYNAFNVFLLAKLKLEHLHYVHIAQTAVAVIMFAAGLWGYDLLHRVRQLLFQHDARLQEPLILRIATKVLKGRHLDECTRSALDFLIENFKLNEAAFLLKDPNSGCFTVKHAYGLDGASLKQFDIGNRLMTWLSQKSEPFIYSDAQQRMAPAAFYQLTHRLRNLPIDLYYPIIHKRALLGLILLGRKRKGVYSTGDLELLTAVGTVLGTAIENSQLSDRAVVDSLTQLFHQKYFKSRLEDQMRVSADLQSCVALIMIDIDHFKRLNDTYGHPAGDKVIESVADTLRSAVRANDVVARYGGEEFAVYIQDSLEQTTRKAKRGQAKRDLINGAKHLAEKIRTKIEHQVIVYRDELFRVTVSVGIGIKDPAEKEMTALDLIRRADQALYRAKEAGRNRTILATASEIRELPQDRPHTESRKRDPQTNLHFGG